jgi:hypothetical protein
MSKKVSLPVMSLTITGVLYIVGLLLISLKAWFLPALVSDFTTTTYLLVNNFLGFLAGFLVIWALTSLVMHPDIEEDNVKWVFIFFGILIAISVFTSIASTIFTPYFSFQMGLGRMVPWW